MRALYDRPVGRKPGVDVAQTIVAAVVVAFGLRMLWRAAQTRALPETWIAVFFLATGVGGELSLRAVVPGTEHALAVRLLFIGVPVLSLATVSGFAFTYTVFRRGEPWAVAIVALGIALAVWGTWSQLGGSSGQPDTFGLRVEFLIGRMACFAWGTLEAFRAHRMARRRLALGLADPVVTNRFLLFGLWFGLMGVNPVILTLSRLYGGAHELEVVNAIAPKIVGTAMVVALILTFFPPRAYLAWVSARAKVSTS
jgi:hypothetical protein